MTFAISLNIEAELDGSLGDVEFEADVGQIDMEMGWLNRFHLIHE